MPVSTSIASSSDLTWDDTDAAWNDPTPSPVDDAWKDFGYADWRVNADDPIALADDAPTFEADAALDESLAVAPSPAKDVGKPLVESFGVADDHANHALKNAIETLGLADARSAEHTLSIAELLGVADQLAKHGGLNLRQTLLVADAIAKATDFERGFVSAIRLAISDDADTALGKTVAETVSFTELLTIAVEKAIAEPLRVAEARRMEVLQDLREALAVIDASSGRTVEKRVDRSLSVAGNHGRHAELRRNETMTLADAFDQVAHFALALIEALGIADDKAISMSKPLTDSFGMADQAPVFDIGLTPVEPLGFLEALDRSVEFRIALEEAIALVSTPSNHVGKPVTEAFKLLDSYIRGGGAIVSNLRVGEGGMTREEFEQMLAYDAEAGFSQFRAFMPGDYELRYALVRYVLEASSSDRPRIRNLRHVVDVPDINDRGQIEVPAGAVATVTFNRTFTIPPEIGLSLKGGTGVGTPRIVGAIRADGFDVEIVDAAGVRLAGTIGWVAQGY